MTCCREPTAPLTERHRLKIRYSGGRPVLVKGPVTGIEYRFSGLERLQLVDPRDAAAIARSSLFRVEGVVEGAGPQLNHPRARRPPRLSSRRRSWLLPAGRVSGIARGNVRVHG